MENKNDSIGTPAPAALREERGQLRRRKISGWEGKSNKEWYPLDQDVEKKG